MAGGAWGEGMNFNNALKLAQSVFDKYKEDHPKWWKRMDGTPILNDVSVRMAEAFVGDSGSVDVFSIPQEKMLHIAKSFLQRTHDNVVTKDQGGNVSCSLLDIELIMAMSVALHHIQEKKK